MTKITYRYYGLIPNQTIFDLFKEDIDLNDFNHTDKSLLKVIIKTKLGNEFNKESKGTIIIKINGIIKFNGTTNDKIYLKLNKLTPIKTIYFIDDRDERD